MAVCRLHLLVPLAMVLVVSSTIWHPAPAVVAIPRPDGCTRIVTTGPSFIGHDCHRATRVTRVDHRVPPRRSAPTRHERPVDRLLSRGKGNLHAQGDKGARRELREKAHRGHGKRHGNNHGNGRARQTISGFARR